MWNDILLLSLNVCNFHFTDVDECQLETDNCAQVCTNTPGSYMCGCDPGYELDGDGFSCNGKMCLNYICYAASIIRYQ